MCDTRSLSFHTSTLLHHGDPYLKMGPFKYELLSNDPHVAIFRDIFSRSECDDFIQRARHDLHSTPYQVSGGQKYFTSQRSSKRLHLTEEEFPLAASASDRISQATDWVVSKEPMASDPYSIINYGLGGQIEVHVDYWGEENKRAGGARLATFLTYLTDVESGGRTVFPGLNISVLPQRGSALLWMTVRPEEQYDTRMFHMGCPVARGNKWAATKWVYSDPQMWTQPCRVDKPHNYPPFQNSFL